MTTKPENPPAFPQTNNTYTGDGFTTFNNERGMTLRDYFAAKAMAAIISNPQFDLNTPARTVAIMSYSTADEMLEVRDEE